MFPDHVAAQEVVVEASGVRPAELGNNSALRHHVTEEWCHPRWVVLGGDARVLIEKPLPSTLLHERLQQMHKAHIARLDLSLVTAVGVLTPCRSLLAWL